MKIVITGAESTGKSILTKQLSQHYQTSYVPEFARNYIEELNRKYNIHDIEAIAKKQIEIEADLPIVSSPTFFDTWLIITKVWFDVVYGNHPIWLEEAIENSDIDLFLLCDIDIPWVYDSVRENGGEARIRLHQTYINELEKYGFPYRIIRGTGDARTQMAIKAVDNYM